MGENDKADLIATTRLPWQARAAADRSRRMSVIGARRIGKTRFVEGVVTEDCARRPGRAWVVICLTRDHCVALYWGSLKKLNKELELGIRFHNVDLRATFPNGSTIRFRGGEQRAEIDKLRGGKYDGVVIDECKSYTRLVFDELVYAVIEPALRDRKGRLIVIGTPGDILEGPFYEATCTPPLAKDTPLGARWSNRRFGDPDDGVPAAWSKHVVSLRENPLCVNCGSVDPGHACDEGYRTIWDEAESDRINQGWGPDHPVYRRETLGEWVPNENRLVYHRYVPSEHDHHGALPDLPAGARWHRVMGFDMGFRDADAAVVWAYSPAHPDLFEVYSEARAKQGIGPMATWLRALRDEYEVEAIAADHGGLAKKVWETLASEYDLVSIPAEKKEKLDFIELLNEDLRAGRIHPRAGGQLSRELVQLRWDESTAMTPRRREDESQPNDLCDAALYAWRWARHRSYVPPKHPVTEGSPAWWAEHRRGERARAVAEARRRAGAETDFSNMDRDWWAN